MPDHSVHASGLAGRYASALFDLARDSDALDAVASDLAGLKTLHGESEDFRRLIESPVLTRDEQSRGVVAVAEKGGAHELTRKFLGVLAEKRRLFALPAMIDAFAAMLADHRGEITAEVVSAAPLTDEQKTTVEKQLAEAAGQKVQISAEVDPALIGGLIVRVGSRMIDASLRGRLHQLELAMKGVA